MRCAGTRISQHLKHELKHEARPATVGPFRVGHLKTHAARQYEKRKIVLA
jgi:hypothetical protein